MGQAQTNYENYTFSSFAGPREVPGSQDGPSGEARFSGPHKIAVDQNGNVFVADWANHTIRKVSPAGTVTTLAGLVGNPGSADGMGAAARFNNPASIAVDGVGNLFVADYGNHTIRKITPAGLVSTVAGKAGLSGSANGMGSAARFNLPIGLALDNTGNIYVADSSNHTIRKVTSGGKVTTLAGQVAASGSADGKGSAARFYYPYGIAADTTGNLYVAELGNSTIRKITAAGVVTTIAGSAGMTGGDNGTGAAARFYQPFDISFRQGNLLVADTYNHTIRQVTLAGEVTTLAGAVGTPGSADGAGSGARFQYPTGVGTDGDGNIFVADYGNNLIRKMAAGEVVTRFTGAPGGAGSTDGPMEAARFSFPASVAVGLGGNLYVADLGNHTIRKITSGGSVSVFAGMAGVLGSLDGIGTAARFNNPLGISSGGSSDLYVVDYANSTIRKINSAGEVTTIAGSPGALGGADGIGSAARFQYPFFLAVAGDGTIYVSDTGNHSIRKITSEGAVTTLAGTSGSPGNMNGTGASARLSFPKGIALDAAGNLFVADSGNDVIRKVTAAGEVTTFAGLAGSFGHVDGTGSAARFNNPMGLAIDGSGNIFVTCLGDNTIRKITPVGVVTTLAGNPNVSGNSDGTGADALFSEVEGLTVDEAGNVYLADARNHSIRIGTRSLPDRAVVDFPNGTVGVIRHLSVNNLTTTSWSWKIIRQPANSVAQLSSSSVLNPTFTPDVPDLYVVRFEGKDAAGRLAINDVTIEAGPADVLSLTVFGQGAVTPDYNNSKLVIGRTYTVTAKPIKGYIFAGWTGDVVSSLAQLTFTMSDNLKLIANFIPDPFPAVAGVYQGLFFEPALVKHESSGFFTGKISTKGSLSAKIQVAGKSYSLSGPLSSTGIMEKTIVRTGLPSLAVSLQVDLGGGDLIAGSITDGSWTAALSADRNTYSKTSPATPVGKFTLVFPGNHGALGSPSGHGFGTVTTDAAGNVKLAGTLGDSTKISQKAIRSKQSRWPLYVSLYAGNGSVLGWLTVGESSITNLGGPVSWIKYAQPTSKLYPDGFAAEFNASGSRYLRMTGVPLISFANGEVEFRDGNLSTEFKNSIAIASDKIANLSPNKLTLSLTAASGLFKGTVVNPATAKSMSFTGAWLQNQGVGYGLFSGTNQTGGVSIRAVP